MSTTLWEALETYDTSSNTDILASGYSIEGCEPSLIKQPEDKIFKFENRILGETWETTDYLELLRWQSSWRFTPEEDEPPTIPSVQAEAEERLNSREASIIKRELETGETLVQEDYSLDKYLTRNDVGDAELCKTFCNEIEDKDGNIYTYSSYVEPEVMAARLNPDGFNLIDLLPVQNEDDEYFDSLPTFNTHFHDMKDSHEVKYKDLLYVTGRLPNRIFKGDNLLHPRVDTTLLKVYRSDKGKALTVSDVFPNIKDSLVASLRLHKLNNRIVVMKNNSWYEIQENIKTSHRALTKIEIKQTPQPLVSFSTSVTKAQAHSLRLEVMTLLLKRNLNSRQAASLAFSWRNNRDQLVWSQEEPGVCISYLPTEKGTVPLVITSRNLNDLRIKSSKELNEEYKSEWVRGLKGDSYQRVRVSPRVEILVQEKIAELKANQSTAIEHLIGQTQKYER